MVDWTQLHIPSRKLFPPTVVVSLLLLEGRKRRFGRLQTFTTDVFYLDPGVEYDSVSRYAMVLDATNNYRFEPFSTMSPF